MEYHSGGSLPLLGRPRYCPGVNANGGYLCETGHCCGETGCCTYYYELWWFWLLWTVLILFSCCCAYRHRRAKLRVQQQQRQREISLLAYHGARSYPSSMLDLSFLASLKLPSYEEVAAQPSTPPPPYSSVFTTPRYPQPPRCADPHLLTQHCALLHQPLSDGPSSLSSDNSSSCSCDSCCPSSPCSSSLSAPVTYETDTSHATTPSEATPLTLDVTIETIAAAARCLEVNETQFVSERMAANDISDEYAAEAQETICAVDSSAPKQTGAVAVVTRPVSPHPLSSPGSEVDLPVVPPNKQLDSVTCAPTVSTCSPSTVEATLPSIQVIDTEGPANCLETAPTLKITSKSDPSAPTASNSDNHTTTHTLNLTRTFDSTSVPSSPTSVPSPDVGRTLALMTGSADLPTWDSNPTLVPIPAPSNLIQQSNPVTTNPTQGLVTVPTDLTPSPETVPINFTQAPDPVPSNLTQVLDLTRVPNSQLKSTTVPDCASDPIITQKPAHTDLTLGTDAALTSTALTHSQITDLSPGLGPIPGPTSPRSGMAQHSLVSCLDPPVPVNSGPSLVLSQSSDVQVGFSSGSGSGSSSSLGFTSGQLSGPAPVHAFPTPAAPSPSCPAITIESESSFPLTQSPPSALSPSSPPSLPSPPSPSLPELSSFSLPGPPLLLDPLNALHQSKKGGSSSGHTSSLSPSPRATQSPPKQTLFSPCVDVFEPGPPRWEDGEERRDEEDNVDDDDDDMGADESQYRHRRLTGDSGIEVCRCRVVEEEEEEEEEEERKEDSRRRVGKERDKNGGVNPDLHDSVDCPARGQTTTGEELCNPTSTTTPTSEDKFVVVMETV